jgi:transposase-like protein
VVAALAVVLWLSRNENADLKANNANLDADAKWLSKSMEYNQMDTTYLKAKLAKCPKCGGDDFDWAGVDSTKTHCSWRCKKCGTDFTQEWFAPPE